MLRTFRAPTRNAHSRSPASPPCGAHHQARWWAPLVPDYRMSRTAQSLQHWVFPWCHLVKEPSVSLTVRPARMGSSMPSRCCPFYRRLLRHPPSGHESVRPNRQAENPQRASSKRSGERAQGQLPVRTLMLAESLTAIPRRANEGKVHDLMKRFGQLRKGQDGVEPEPRQEGRPVPQQHPVPLERRQLSASWRVRPCWLPRLRQSEKGR